MPYPIEVTIEYNGRQAVYCTDGHMNVDGTLCVVDWAAGKYSCDCNRSRCFARALGQEDPPYPVPCGSGKYRIVKIVDPREPNVVLYQEP